MATVNRFVNTASTAGGDGTTNNTTGSTRAYASLSEWESNEQTDLVTDGDTHVCTFEGTDTTAFTINGWTTGASNSVKITVAEANRHTGTAGSGSALISNSSNGSHVITISDNFIQILYLEIYQKSSGGSDEGIRFTSGVSDVVISRCILHSDRAAADQDLLYAGNWAVTDINIDNCIIYKTRRAGIHAQVFSTNSTQTWNIDHCTVFDCGTVGGDQSGGIRARAGATGSTINLNIYNTFVADTNAEVDFSETGNGTVNWAGTNNACTDTSLTTVGLTTGAQESLTSSDELTNVTDGSEDLHVKNSSASIFENGTDRVSSEPDSRQDFSLDFEDDTRSTSSPAPDIGADEFISATTATSLFDFKGRILSDATSLFDFKGIILSDTTSLFDFKGRILDATTQTFDFKGRIKDTVTANFDSKGVVLDTATSLFDFKGIISTVSSATSLFDFKGRILSDTTSLFDLKGRILSDTTSLFDFKGIILSDTTSLFDFKGIVLDTATSIFDLKGRILSDTTSLFDFKGIILSDTTSLFDFKGRIMDSATSLFDFKGRILSDTTSLFDFKGAVLSDTTSLFDFKGAVLSDTTSLFDFKGRILDATTQTFDFKGEVIGGLTPSIFTIFEESVNLQIFRESISLQIYREDVNIKKHRETINL